MPMVEIPVFPLPLVLFPGGRLPLQIFETRYLDMVAHCMRDDAGFGIVMIVEGEQTLVKQGGGLPSVSRFGTYARIIDFDQHANGMLTILTEGQTKFEILDQYEQADGLMLASIRTLKPEAEASVPKDQAHLLGLLETLMEHKAVRRLGLTCDMGKATEVGARLTELLPCPNHFKQRLLEIGDPLERLIELGRLVDRLEQGQ